MKNEKCFPRPSVEPPKPDVDTEGSEDQDEESEPAYGYGSAKSNQLEGGNEGDWHADAAEETDYFDAEWSGERGRRCLLCYVFTAMLMSTIAHVRRREELYDKCSGLPARNSISVLHYSSHVGVTNFDVIVALV